MKKIELLKNYNTDGSDIFFYVCPEPETKEGESVMYTAVRTISGYEKYWNNNWRRLHGYSSLRRRNLYTSYFIVKPTLLSVEETNDLYDKYRELEPLFGEKWWLD